MLNYLLLATSKLQNKDAQSIDVIKTLKLTDVINYSSDSIILLYRT